MLPPPAFHRQLALVTLLCAAGITALYYLVPDLQQRVTYLAALLLGSAAFTWVEQAVAERLARHRNPGMLLNFVMALTGLKMFFAIAIVYGYHEYAAPATRDFLWPFGWVYLVYTSFETYALVRLSFATAPKKPDRLAERRPRE